MSDAKSINPDDRWIAVPKEQFDAAVQAYPRPLRENVVRICEPPQIYFLDFTLPSEHETGTMERYFDSAVAFISTDWLGPNGEVNNGERFWKYHLRPALAGDVIRSAETNKPGPAGPGHCGPAPQ